MIERPVAFSGAALAAVEASQGQLGGLEWSNAELNPVRAAVKSQCLPQQAHRCCYCYREILSTNGRVWDVEHVVPKSTHPEFTFEPRNLAIACPDCNIAKGEVETLVNSARVTYPDTSDAFLVVHPHFDEYAEHIVNLGLMYWPVTPKGEWTIYKCKLLRYLQAFMGWPDDISDDRFEAALEGLRQGGPNAIDALAVMVARLAAPNPPQANGTP
jgi:uncharacterized protein (TIGR02646 family)